MIKDMTPRHVEILGAALILSFMGMALMFYWAVMDGRYVNPVLNQESIEYSTNKTTYHKGEDILVIVDGLCKLRNFPADTYINIIDTIQYSYPMITRSIPVGCIRSESMTPFLTLPKEIPSGSYHLQGYFSYDINPIRKGVNSIKIPFISREFNIVD